MGQPTDPPVTQPDAAADPDPSPPGLAELPQGIQTVLRRAADEWRLRKTVLDGAFHALPSFGLELSETERQILTSVPRDNLALMLDRLAGSAKREAQARAEHVEMFTCGGAAPESPPRRPITGRGPRPRPSLVRPLFVFGLLVSAVIGLLVWLLT